MNSADWRGHPPGLPNQRCKRLVVVGAECTGKSTLCRALAEALQTAFVTEYLRTFVSVFGRLPRSNDSAYIIASQQALRFKAIAGRSSGWIVEDTDEWSTQIYHQYYFNQALDVEALGAQLPDAYVLCRPDIPWVPDGNLRDGPRVRELLSQQFEQHVEHSGIPYLAVDGSLSSRRATVLKWIETDWAAQRS